MSEHGIITCTMENSEYLRKGELKNLAKEISVKHGINISDSALKNRAKKMKFQEDAQEHLNIKQAKG